MDKKNDIENNGADGEREVGFFERAKEIDRAEKEKELRAEEQAQKEAAEQRDVIRAEHEERLRRERVELMKKRAGIDADESLIGPEKHEEKVYTTKEKIGNFWYHYKWRVLGGALAALVAGVFVYDIVTKIEPDAGVMILTENFDISMNYENIAAYMEQFCDDYNHDKHIDVAVDYIAQTDSTGANFQMLQANQVKFMAELQAYDFMIVMADKPSLAKLEINDALVDMRNIFPGDERANELGYDISGTDFAKKCGLEELPDGMMLCVRQNMGMSEGNKMQAAQDNSIELVRKTVADLQNK